jgi:hypothetical protein
MSAVYFGFIILTASFMSSALPLVYSNQEKESACWARMIISYGSDIFRYFFPAIAIAYFLQVGIRKIDAEQKFPFFSAARLFLRLFSVLFIGLLFWAIFDTSFEALIFMTSPPPLPRNSGEIDLALCISRVGTVSPSPIFLWLSSPPH